MIGQLLINSMVVSTENSDSEKAWLQEKRHELREMQALPLLSKIKLSQDLITEAIYTFGAEQIYVSFSGGKDSTVLSHLVRQLEPHILHLFADTSCEYPETISFVSEMQMAGINIETVCPKDRAGQPWTFERVVEEHGYPAFSKAVSNGIRTYRNAKSASTKQNSIDYMTRRFPSYLPYLNCNVSDLCCEKLKKGPLKRFARQMGMQCSIIGTLAEESQTRERDWLRYGSNIFFVKADNQCRPLSFWRDCDVWDYIRLFNIPIATLYNKGYERNGCMYCGFGIKGEKRRLGMNRLERLRHTHPQEYNYLVDHFHEILDVCNIEY